MDQSASLHICSRSNCLVAVWCVLEAALTAWGFHTTGSTPASVRMTFIHLASVCDVTLMCGRW